MSQLELFSDGFSKKENREDLPTKTCTMCKNTYSVDNFVKMVTTGTGKQFYVSYCRTCHRKRSDLVKELKKTAPHQGTECECCGISFQDLSKRNIHMDHCEETKSFRGWLCRKCNLGIGFLGDNLYGINKAADYLKRHENER